MKILSNNYKKESMIPMHMSSLSIPDKQKGVDTTPLLNILLTMNIISLVAFIYKS